MPILSKNAPRALSIAGAYPLLIAKGEKAIEIRCWGEKAHRGLTFLHASSGSAFEHSFAEWGLSRQQCPKYSFVGAADLVEVIQYDSPEKWEKDIPLHRWDADYWEVVDCYDGKLPYGHRFRNPILFSDPITNIEGTFRYWLPKSERQKAGFKRGIKLLETTGYLS
jgi:hypothetical protein